jgi:hydrogenase expression/formation protein HypC
MCIGIPMQVVEAYESCALCADRDGRRVQIDTLLVGRQVAGAWLLTFLDTAREVLAEDRARDILGALQAMDAAGRGESFEHLIADLIDREPQLPEFLRAQDKPPEPRL